MNSRLGLVPVLGGDACLAKNFFDETTANVADMRIRNAKFLGSLDHELVFST